MEKIKLQDPAIVEPVKEHKPTTDTSSVAQPTTTAEENRKTAGQRVVNIFWEATQAFIAVTITGAIIYAELNGIETQALGNALMMILAMYFQRTNHTKIGGVGGTDSR